MDKIGQGERLFIKNFKAHASPLGKTGGRQAQSGLVDVLCRDGDVFAVVGQLVGHIMPFKPFNDRGCIRIRQISIEKLVIGGLRLDDDKGKQANGEGGYRSQCYLAR